MNLGAYRADVRADTGFPPTDVVSQDEIDRRINDSYFEILGDFRHNRMKRDSTTSTVNGTQEYALPADYWYMRVFKDDTNVQRLTYKRLEWIEEQDQGTTDIGQPLYWTVEDTNVRVYPTPDRIYTLHFWYMARPAPLTLSTDQDVLEREWTEIIKLGAVQRVFYLLGEIDRQVHAMNLQQRLVDKIMEATDIDAETGATVIGPLLEETAITR